MEFLIIFLLDFLLPFLLDLLTNDFLSRYVFKNAYDIDEDFSKAVGVVVLSGSLGSILGGMSLVVSTHYWIDDQRLQIAALFGVPAAAGLALWAWARFRRREIWQAQLFAFCGGFLFLFGFMSTRLAACTWM